MDPAPFANEPLRVALLGLGTVGRAVAERLLDGAWREDVRSRGETPPELVAVGVREPDRARGIQLPDTLRRTDDLAALVVDPAIDVVVELLGGVDGPKELLDKALAAGKRVVTANKALLAEHGPALETAVRAAGVALRFEAAVAAGIPVLGPLVLDLAANRIDVVRGIVNGTTNHILSAMAGEGRTYEDVLDEAKARGYAEADPANDVEGLDAAAKLAILARLAFGEWPDPAALRRSAPAVSGDAPAGITGITPRELRGAAQLGLTLKLVARVERRGDGEVRAAVTPAAVPQTSVLGRTDGVINVVEVLAVPVGRVAFRGPGAGGDATASAVLADLLAFSRGAGSTWDPLPASARAQISVRDDLDGPRAWYFCAPELAAGHVPSRITELALAATEDAFVTRPMELDEVRIRLADTGLSVTLYPVLEMGQG